MSSWDALGIPNPILNETWLPDLRRCLYKNHGIKHANVTNSTKLICSRSLFSAKNWRGRRAKARAKRWCDFMTTSPRFGVVVIGAVPPVESCGFYRVPHWN